MKRLLLIVLTLVMILTACSIQGVTPGTSSAPTQAVTSAQASSQAANAAEPGAPEWGDPNVNLTGYPVVKKPVTIKGFGNQHINHGDWREVTCFKTLEEMTGVHVEWTTAPNEGFAERRSVLLASGDYPDIFFRCNFSVSDLVKYGSQGVFVPLNDLIDYYAPNFNERNNEHPWIRKGITMPDGNIYAMPELYDPNLPTVYQFNWINSRWLKNVGLEIPNTTEEFYQVLKAFKEKDANGNGDPNDEIPYSDRSGGASLWSSTYGSFGLGNLGRTLADQYIYVDENGKIALAAITDNFRKQTEWIHKLYSEKLIDDEIFTQDIATFTAKGQQDQIGAFFMNNAPIIIGQLEYEFEPVRVLQGPDGHREYNYMSSPIYRYGCFAISPTNPYPEASMRWLDTMYSIEGDIIMRLGVEGLTYVKNADGTYQYTDYVNKNPDGLTVSQVIAQYAIAPSGGGCPGFAFYAHESGRLPESSLKAKSVVEVDIKKGFSPVTLLFTIEEQERLDAIANDIRSYINESRVLFVTGRMSFSEWDKYVATINKMGADEYVSIYQEAYDRYMNN